MSRSGRQEMIGRFGSVEWSLTSGLYTSQWRDDRMMASKLQRQIFTLSC